MSTAVEHEYRTAPLSFPLHILNEYGEPLCGNLTEQQEKYLGKKGYTHLPTVDQKRADEDWVMFLTGLCGTCRKIFVEEVDNEEIAAAWQRYQEAMRHA